MLVSIIMGSKSDLEVMKEAMDTLTSLEVSHEYRILSAHRTPEALRDYLGTLPHLGVKVVIAAAGGAAHLPGVIASSTILPVIGVPMMSCLNGIDSLLSINQMPKGIPVATMAIGKSGAGNAALYAASILAVSDPGMATKLTEYRKQQALKVLEG